MNERIGNSSNIFEASALSRSLSCSFVVRLLFSLQEQEEVAVVAEGSELELLVESSDKNCGGITAV